jgi:hypothetical protein
MYISLRHCLWHKYVCMCRSCLCDMPLFLLRSDRKYEVLLLIRVVSCYCCMAHPQDGAGGLHIWRTFAHILNKQLCTVRRGWSSGLRVDLGAIKYSL